MPLIDIETQPESLTNFNARKVEELATAALIAGGYTFPPILPVTISDENTLINITIESGTYNEIETADIIDILNGVCLDPTRNDLTEDQQELADLQNKLDNAIADIAIINDVPGGLKDQINAATTGLKDRLLTNAAWNAIPTTAAGAHQKADTIRLVLRDTLTLIVDHLNVSLHGARADKFELKHIQDVLEE